ncbi:MAG: AAA domain-containing protein [Candidatus Cyclobacteriaceae bacterium M3_2C_046]
MTSLEELQNLLHLLQMEKKHDLEWYKNKILYASVNDKQQEGVCWYPVMIHRSYIGTGEKVVVEVRRTNHQKEPHAFQSGNVVRFFSNSGPGKSEAGGVVNMIKGETMIINLNNDDFPDWLDAGNLGVDLLFDEASYLEMENALKRLMELDKGRVKELREILLGYQPARFARVDALSSPLLNTSQQEALHLVRSALDLAIIHGPPGTGKTTTLVQAIKATLQEENQVLVCAPSNAAVDLLVEKLGEQDLRVLRLGHPARVTDSVLSRTLDARIAEHQAYRDIKKLRKKAEELKRAGWKFKRKFGKAERQQRKLLLQEAGRMLSEADLLEHYIVNDLLHKSQVIACTLVGANHNLLKGSTFSTVFIDEAAQALEPACWIPILKSERVVFAGDHWQLPPTVKSVQAQKEGLGQTLFEKSIARNQAGQMLQEQYRMHQKIMQFSSQFFYQDHLNAHVSVAERLLKADDRPVEMIDTAGCGFTEKINPESKSLYNSEEAAWLIKHLKDYLLSIDEELWLKGQVQIGIVSPYKAQVSLISDRVAGDSDFQPFLKNITIDTIDAFQGRERDIIYISLVRSNDRNEIGFLSDTRRMNVALTRAKMKLVIFGDSATLGGHSFYEELLFYINSIKAYRSVYEFMYE